MNTILFSIRTGCCNCIEKKMTQISNLFDMMKKGSRFINSKKKKKKRKRERAREEDWNLLRGG